MGILRLLVELYQFADLKLNLKFEIEVLCKSLNIDVSGKLYFEWRLFVDICANANCGAIQMFLPHPC